MDEILFNDNLIGKVITDCICNLKTYLFMKNKIIYIYIYNICNGNIYHIKLERLV